MTDYSNLLIDPCGNANYIYKYNETTPENSYPIYGISGEKYIIKYGPSCQTVDINDETINISGMPFIGYRESDMKLYDVDGNDIDLPGVNNLTIINAIKETLITKN